MFNDDEWQALSSELLKLSVQGRLKWEYWQNGYSTTVQDDRYVVGSRDADGRPPYYLAAYKEGFIEEIGEMGSALVASIETVPSSYETSASRDRTTENILQLATLAERLAKGTPQLFKELLGNLQDLEDPEPPF